MTACAHTPPYLTKIGLGEKEPYQNELSIGISIYFANNSTQIDSSYEPYLAASAKILSKNPNLYLQVEGHTDNTGSIKNNVRVSLKRANIVKMRLLADYNVDPSQIVTAGLGPNHPIDNNHTAEGRANNRRVTLTLKEN